MSIKTTELKGYFNGLVLGDGYIDKGTHKRAFRIKNTSKYFIGSIGRFIKDNTDFKFKVKYFKPSIRNGVNRKAYWELTVKAHPYFRKMFHYFYDDYRNRRITTKSLKELTPAGIANWYMSDGYIVLVGKTKGVIRSRRVELCLDRYTLEDVIKVKAYFESYGLSTHLVKRKQDTYRLRFHLSTVDILFDMIRPYIVEDMQYKLNLCY